MDLQNQTSYNLERGVVYITSEVIIVLESLDPLLLLVVEPRGLVATSDLVCSVMAPSIAIGPGFTPDYILVIYLEYSWVVHSLVHFFSFVVNVFYLLI